MYPGNTKPELTDLCHLGLPAGDDCAHRHVASLLDKGSGGTKSLRLCPGHGGREATLSLNGGRDYRLVWKEHAETCDLEDRDIHALLLTRGADESCLGTYGLRKDGRLKPAARIQSYDPAMAADANRWHAMQKLSGELPGRLMVMCRQAIAEGDGYLPGDPFALLPRTKQEFISLAKRSGIQRGYHHALWARWSDLLLSEAA